MTSHGKIRFDVIFEAVGHNDAKFRNDVQVFMRGAHPASYHLPTDEGAMHGGDASAPYPLAYFASALTACVMTQIRAFAKRLSLKVDNFDVSTRCHWQGEQVGNAPYVSVPVAFNMDIDIRGQLSNSDKRELLKAAQSGCFIEASLKPGLVVHRLLLDDEWTEV
ncbi:OsmC family protein [Tardiphaga sp. vice304]|uniref:OsmC family protein n=1 Tax=Tardiphaga sp. vice304 TaxID=2592817 RepID=UPI001164E297|nr:OsmC family protein [Tardiphaga sp. vice304]QDM25959.1 OsmC family protein [Tardiphaga sp. vice304]